MFELLTFARRYLSDAENHKLCWLDWRYTDFANEHPGIDVLLGIGLPVAFHIERFVGCSPKQSTSPPGLSEERGDVSPNPRPQSFVVRLEYHPLGADVNGKLNIVGEASNVNVAPLRGSLCQRASSPNANASTGEV